MMKMTIVISDWIGEKKSNLKIIIREKEREIAPFFVFIYH